MSRLIWIDNLRGILILLVVLGHSIQYGLSDWEQNHLFNYIYSFHMPLFMCVSGFVSLRMKISWKQMRKRFCQLIIPFLSMAIVYSICQGENLLLSWIINPTKGLWFLWCLFFIICIHTFVLWVALQFSWIKEELLSLGVVLVLIASMRYFSIFGYPTICKFYLFFMIGFYMHKHYYSIQQQLDKMMWPLLIVFLVMAYFFKLTSIPTFMQAYDNVIVRQLYGIVISCVAICCFIPLSERFLTEKLFFLTGLGGGKTLGIYAFHQFIMGLWPCNIFLKLSDSNQVFVFLTWVVAFVISYLLVILAEKNKVMSFLFLGKQIINNV